MWISQQRCGRFILVPRFQTYPEIQSSTACFKLGHQIEIRVSRLIIKGLMVLKTC